MPVQQRWILLIAGAIWLTAGLGGGAVLYHYAYTPGEKGKVRQLWPAESRLTRNAEGDTLVVAVHPQCPCTRASMAELNDLMLSLRGKVEAYVLVVKPREFPAEWADTEMVRRAREIPGVRVVLDVDGVKASLFGTQTSGQAVLYDAQGRLAFNGGLTASRGHIGDNAGVQRIAELVNTGKADQAGSLVYGCPLNAKVCVLKKSDASLSEIKGAENDN